MVKKPLWHLLLELPLRCRHQKDHVVTQSKWHVSGVDGERSDALAYQDHVRPVPG